MQFDPLKQREATIFEGDGAPQRQRTSAARQEIVASNPHRRELLRSFLAAALAATWSWQRDVLAATLPLERDRFIELSEKLCAMSTRDKSLGEAIQNALADYYDAADFKRMAELLHSAPPDDVDRLLASSGLQKLAKAIVSGWYSGFVGTGESTRVLAYEGALAWQATGYAKAPGICGEFGDWATKPPSTPDRGRGQ